MKIIATLVDRIDDELEGAETYIKLAFETHEEYPRLADKFAELSEVEMSHMKTLHGEATKLIEEVRERDGAPPPEMMAVYNFEHSKQTKRAALIRQMITDYKNS